MNYQEELKLSTKGYCDLIKITSKIKKVISNSGIKEGLVLVFVTGSTAGITTIEFEPNLVKDFKEFIEKLIPADKDYHHNKTWGDGNGFSHIRASLIGPSLAVSLNQGSLELGQWQEVVLCDFDNRSREREIVIKVIGD